jgi:hypothetical protein
VPAVAERILRPGTAVTKRIGAALGSVGQRIVASRPAATWFLGAPLALAGRLLAPRPVTGCLVRPEVVPARLARSQPFARRRFSDGRVPGSSLARPALCLSPSLPSVALGLSRAADEGRDLGPGSEAAWRPSEFLGRDHRGGLAAGRPGRLRRGAEHLVPPDEDTNDEQQQREARDGDGHVDQRKRARHCASDQQAEGNDHDRYDRAEPNHLPAPMPA